jgi:hypothetical protein
MSTRRRNPKLVSGPQLGDTTFEDWYETPVFEAEPDERLEQLAMSKRAPVRLVGSTALRLGAHRESLSERRGAAREPLRDRVSILLDRWAEREMAGSARLEELVLPRRWRK